MGMSLILEHEVQSGWLSYSHGAAPTDRQVVSGITSTVNLGIRYAQHYFLSDAAVQLMNGSFCNLIWRNTHWQLFFIDRGRAALFKLRFL